MPLPYPKSSLDAHQIWQFAFDENSGRLRTDGTFSGSITVNLDSLNDSVSIGDSVSGHKLVINADGTINANVAVEHTSDSIRLGNGVDYLTSTTVGAAKTLDVAVKEAPLSLAQESTQQAVQALLTTISGQLTTVNTRALVFSTDKVDISNSTNVGVIGPLTNTELRASAIAISATSLPLPSGAATDALQNAANVILTSIDGKLTSPLTVNATLADEPIKMSGTENGLPTGTEFTVVNNRRLQILGAKDREQSITYADFGTKNQRITQIDYTAASIGTGVGYTARKTFTYTLVGTNYRRDSINWTLF